MVRAVTVLMALLVVTLAVPTVAVADELPGEDEPIAGPGVTFNASDGPALTVGETTEFRNTNPWVSNQKIELEPWGWAHSNGPTAVNITEFNGTWTQLQEIDATGADLTINPNDKERVTLGGDIQRFEWRDNIALDDATQDFRYGGPSGTAEVTLTEVPATTEIAAVDASSGEVLDAARSDATGNVTFDQLPQSDHDVLLQSYSSSTPTASSLSPEGTNAEDDPQNIQLSADVSDPDFGRSSDEVVVEFRIEGSVVDTQTISSNQTVTTTVSRTTGRDYDWSVDLTDQFENTGTASSQFVVANTLFIYNESSPTKLVDNAEVELRFYQGPQGQFITNRTANNGKVNMTGLPATEPFIVVADADGFVPRRIYVQNLTEQQKVFLLPQSANYVSPVFKLKDLSGLYPAENTVLIIKRPLNGTVQTVQADYFGATGEFKAQLAYNVRHQMILLNTETGRTRDIGAYTPLASREQTIEVLPDGGIDIQGVGAIISVGPSTRAVPARNDVQLSISVNGSQDTTITSWTGEVRYKGTVLNQTSRSSPGEWTPQVNLTGKDSGNVSVVIDWTTKDGRTGSRTVTFSVRETFENRFSLLNILMSGLPALFPATSLTALTTMLALLTTVIGTAVVGYELRTSSETVGLVAVGFLTFFGVIGFLSYQTVFVSAVAWFAFFAIRRAI